MFRQRAKNIGGSGEPWSLLLCGVDAEGEVDGGRAERSGGRQNSVKNDLECRPYATAGWSVEFMALQGPRGRSERKVVEHLSGCSDKTQQGQEAARSCFQWLAVLLFTLNWR